MIYKICEHISGDTWGGIATIVLKANDIPINISGAYIEFVVKYSIASPELVTLTTANSGIDIASPVLGVISIHPTIIDIPPGKYGWYLNMKLPSSNIRTYLNGIWEILPRIPEATDYEKRNY
jgi:hypothetical protein